MKKGFTLIELLAVIVILAIIALIATPIILGIIEDARNESKLRSAELYITAIEQAILRKRMNDGTSFEPTSCTITGRIVTCNVDYDNDGNDDSLQVDVGGNLPTNGNITLSNGKIVSHSLVIDGTTIVDGVIKETVTLESKSFSEDSWETIVANVRAGTIDKYEIGATKEIELEGFGKHTVRIVNTSTPEECNTPGFSQTACGFVIEFADIITSYYMNPYTDEYADGTNTGGWESSAMREYVNDTIFKSLPDNLKNIIIDTYVVSGCEVDIDKNYITTDKLYLLSTTELWKYVKPEDFEYGLDYDMARNLTRQLDYYNDVIIQFYYDVGWQGNIINAEKNIKNDSNWYLRSANGGNYYSFYYVHSSGNWDGYDPAHAEYGVAPAFRIG